MGPSSTPARYLHAVPLPPHSPPPQPPPPPSEGPAERTAAALLDAARRGLDAPPADDGPADQAGADPSHWAGRSRVAIWRAGARLAAGEAGDPDPLRAIQRAAAAASAALPPDHRDRDDLSLLVETVEAVQPLQPAGLSGLIAAVQLGLHGLVLHHDGRTVVGWPGDALRDHNGVAPWVKALLKQLRPPGARLPPSAAVLRFSVRQAAGPRTPPSDAASAALPLLAGHRLLPSTAVNEAWLRRATLEAAAWLVRHQRRDGLFRYEYQPDARRWSTADSLVRQAGCAWSLAALSQAPDGLPFLPPARRALAGIAAAALRRDGPGRLYYLVDRSGQARLGAIPLLLLAAADLRRHNPLPADTVNRLTATLLAVQRPDGAFGAHARGLTLEGSQRYFAGQIALALARRHALAERAPLARAVESALRHYHDRWQAGDRDLSFAAWMLQACDAWHAQSDAPLAADFAYAMADWALQFQHLPRPPDATPADSPAPNPLWLGAYGDTPGIGTAAYTEGMLGALAIARRRGDADRAHRYARSVLLALRFLLQLTVEPADLPFVGGPEQRGALRASLRRRSLRCDHAQHFLMAAHRAAAALTPDDYAAAAGPLTSAEPPLPL